MVFSTSFLLRLVLTFILMATSAVAAPTASSWKAFQDARQRGTPAKLPDYSYVGYERSEEPLPVIDGPLFDVTDYGATADDYRSDRDAIQAAIDAAEAAGGGVVFFPAGRFHLNTWSDPGEPIQIEGSHIILRGAGAWNGGTELFMEARFQPEHPDRLYSTPEMIQIGQTGRELRELSKVIGSTTRGAFQITVNEPANFSAGQWITLQVDSPEAAVKTVAPKQIAPEWTRLKDGLQIRERHQVASIEGNVLTLAEPVQVDIDAAHGWRVMDYPHLSGIGIEDIAFRGNWLGAFDHHRSALDDSAWSALKINSVVNGWIQRCRFINWNEAVALFDTSLFTILHTRIEGNAGHFGIHTRGGYGVLVALSDDLAGQWHGPSVGYRSAGSVFWRFDYPAETSFDAHGSGPYATLLDAVSGGWKRGHSGGPLAGMPNHLRGLTLWNFEHTGDPVSRYDVWPEDFNTRSRFLFPNIIGFHGSESTFIEEHLGIYESMGTPVAPESLFEAQLSLRLGGLPSFIADWRATWDELKRRPAEQVVRVDSAAALTEALRAAEPGTRLVFEKGVYRDMELVFDGTLTPNGSGGTSDAPIVLTAERAGDVVFTGASTLRIAGRHMHVENLLFTEGALDSGAIIRFETDSDNRANHCLLANSAIVAFNPDDPDRDYDWVEISGRFNRVEHCQFSDMTHKGVQLVVRLDPNEAPATPTIRGNYFADRAPGKGNGYETIRVGTSTRSLLRTEALVEGNLFERLDGEIEIISNKSVGNIYRGNTFRENNGQLTLRHGSHCLVDGNFFFGEGKEGSGGLRVVGPNHTVINNYFADLNGGTLFRGAISLMNGVPDSPLNRYRPVANLLVAHNTIVNCAYPVTIGVESSAGDTIIPPESALFANNVIVGGTSPQFTFVNQPRDFSYVRHFAFGAEHGLPKEAEVIAADPQWTRGAAGVFRPGAASPLLDAANARATPRVATDLDGQPRPLIGRDLGADERSSAPARYRPLTAADVGPSWSVEASLKRNMEP